MKNDEQEKQNLKDRLTSRAKPESEESGSRLSGLREKFARKTAEAGKTADTVKKCTSIRERLSAGSPALPQAEKDGQSDWKTRLSDWRLTLGLAGLCAVLAITSVSLYSSGTGKDGQIAELETTVATKADTLSKTSKDLDQASKDLEKHKKELETLKVELDELKNGPAKQLEQVKGYSMDKNWNSVVEAAGKLHKAYPGSAEDQEAQKLKAQADAEIQKAAEAKRQEEERKKAEEAARKAEEERKKAEEEARGYETGISYDQLARYPDQYEGQKVKFYGKVLQVMNDGSIYQIRLAVNDNYDTVVMGLFTSSIMTNGKILEDDEITIYGVSAGDYTYKAVMGNSITVPMIRIEKIDQ